MARTDSTIAAEADVSLLAIPRESELLLLGFSALGAADDRFHFYPLQEMYPDTSILLVRDPRGHWYNDGLPGIGYTMAEITAHLKAEIDGLGAQRVLAVGFSMGSYAAILFGCAIGAERVVGLSPQTLLSADLPAWAPPRDVQLQVPDLKPVVESAPETRIDLAVGWDELIDVFQAQRVASSPTVRVLGIADAGHGLPGRLHRKGAYWPLVRALIDDVGGSDLYEAKPPLPAEVVDELHVATFAWNGGDPQVTVEIAARLAERYPDWQAPRRTLRAALTVRPELARPAPIGAGP